MDSGVPVKRSVRVTIANQSFVLNTSGGDDAELLELANMVDELISGIAQRTSGSHDTARLAILACLHLADQLRSTEREFDDLRLRLEQKAKHFQGLLDEVIE